ncbi:MAG: hypothetical protein RMM17_02145 [Acidobacteriota bacterium]|nr:hypothetical protein [Blastocatellia bacterium]MDW8411470.1 hypothetical protein [Acidobacteriota bacterium]
MNPKKHITNQEEIKVFRHGQVQRENNPPVGLGVYLRGNQTSDARLCLRPHLDCALSRQVELNIRASR